MDFLFGFVVGYFLKEASLYLKKISQWDLDNRVHEEDWDWTSHEDLP